MIKLPNIENIPKEPKCKGLFFRASISCFLSSHNSIESKKSLRLLKRKSCNGCPQCSWVLEEEFPEYIVNVDFAKDMDNIEHGKIYELVSIVTPGPFEYPDEVEIDFELKERQDETC